MNGNGLRTILVLRHSKGSAPLWRVHYMFAFGERS
jgi:hypothetical protein